MLQTKQKRETKNRKSKMKKNESVNKNLRMPAMNAAVPQKRERFPDPLQGILYTCSADQHGIGWCDHRSHDSGNCRSYRLIDKAQDTEVGEHPSIFGGLPLSLVEVSRHSDDYICN